MTQGFRTLLPLRPSTLKAEREVQTFHLLFSDWHALLLIIIISQNFPSADKMKNKILIFTLRQLIFSKSNLLHEESFRDRAVGADGVVAKNYYIIPVEIFNLKSSPPSFSPQNLVFNSNRLLYQNKTLLSIVGMFHETSEYICFI